MYLTIQNEVRETWTIGWVVALPNNKLQSRAHVGVRGEGAPVALLSLSSPTLLDGLLLENASVRWIAL